MKKTFTLLSTVAVLLAGCSLWSTANEVPPAPPSQPQTEAQESAKVPDTKEPEASTEKKPGVDVKVETKVETSAPQIFSMAVDNLFFKPAKLTVKAGQPVTINFNNNGFHTFTIDALGVDVNLKSVSSGTATFTPKEKGTFEYYCSVPGHKAGGMVGTLVVE